MRAFSLLEVMIACFVFFLVAFSVLELTTRSLAAAKAIRKPRLDPGMLAALVSTNRFLEEGPHSLDLSALGEEYRDYQFSYLVEGSTNDLFRVTLEVAPVSGAGEPARMTTYFYRPGSSKSRRFGGPGL